MNWTGIPIGTGHSPQPTGGVYRAIARLLTALAALAGALLIAGCEQHQAGNIRIADAPGGEWPSYGLTPSEQRFSPLTQVNRETVARLGLAWYHELETDRGQQATPIMVDGVLYVSTAWSKVLAFDATSGQLLWSFDPEVKPEFLARTCCDAVNRGVALWDGMVYVAALDGRLIALSAKTGKVLWTTQTVDPRQSYSSTGAVRVFGGKVLIGNSGAEFGVRGYVSAYDAKTGKREWRFYVTPNARGEADGEVSDDVLADKAAPTWFGDGWKQTGGGGTVWDAMAYDPETGLLYVGTGNGAPQNHQLRSDGKGDNLFLSSILALRLDSGAYVWHYQTTPGDSWDYTATQPIILADLTLKGVKRKVLMQAPKNGFFYVLDRLTGALLSADAFVDLNWASGVDPRTGRPIEVAAARYVGKPSLVMPGALGAHSWHPMAFSPQTGLVYIPVQKIAQGFASEPDYRFREGRFNLGFDLRTVAFPDDPAEKAKIRAGVTGELLAWDPVARKPRWSVPLPSYLNGGVLATAGGLVFQGTAEGEFHAYDAADGTPLWSYSAGNGIVAAPMTYKIGDRQYVAMLIGYGGAGVMLGAFLPDRPRLPGRLLVFALDGTAKAPAYEVAAPFPVDVEGEESRGNPAKGLALFNDHCLICHGFGADSRYTADLRRSGALGSAEAWQSIVMDGALKDRGMVSFARYLSPAGAEDIRAYVRQRATKAAALKAELPPASPE